MTASEGTGETAVETGSRSGRPIVLGKVVSAKMQDTIVVRQDRSVKHPLYEKYVRRSTKYYAHDPGNSANEGDEVEIVQTRPISKLKRWRLARIVRASEGSGDSAAGGSEPAGQEAPL